MANTYFQFKQFRIDQEFCAMKVCTDACILGAWFASDAHQYKRILDIGSGTGLLMMMIAQQSDATIDGIEIEDECFQQLVANITQNVWSTRLKAIHGDVRSFQFDQRYDFIISNPPFFEDDLLSPTTNKQLAMHSKELKLEELAASVVRNLQPGGRLGILLPYHRLKTFSSIGERHGLQLVHEIKIKQTPKHNWFRSVATYRLTGTAENAPAASEPPSVASYYAAAQVPDQLSLISELAIRDSAGGYSPEFRELLKDYYLHL
jgi:tRNA1Val (adenine37-N6)-methyltransferase